MFYLKKKKNFKRMAGRAMLIKITLYAKNININTTNLLFIWPRKM